LKVSELSAERDLDFVGHEIHYEECGNPQGKAAVFLHGGPGVGIASVYRQFFDPKFWRVVLPDQRGAGKSTPHAELRENTTWELIEDLEKLRKHLGIQSWVVMGGSWGSFLALAYAIMHPASVKGVIIRGVMLGRKSETDWLFQSGMNWVYPQEWEEFIQIPNRKSQIPNSSQTPPNPPAGGEGPKPPELGLPPILRAYFDMMGSGDEELAKKAVIGWSKWEGAANTLIPTEENDDFFEDLHRAISIGRIECWYTLNNWFLKEDNWLLDNVHRMKDVPLWIVQGRFDLICPAKSAYELHRAHPKSKLKIVQLGAHSPVEEPMAEWLVKAGEEFKSL
jgi:proline iminopeptidase